MGRYRLRKTLVQVVPSLFYQPFQALHRAIDRIAAQLKLADDEQRPYLLEELAALRQAGEQILGAWVDVEDKAQALLEQYGVPVAADPWPASPPETPPLSSDLGTCLTSAVASNWFRRGLGYFDLLMYKEARVEFERIVRRDPDMMVARLYLALCYVSAGHFEEAERHLHILCHSARDPAVRAAAHDARAQALFRQGRWREAGDELAKALAERPEYVDAHVNRAICAYVCQEYEVALEHSLCATTFDDRDMVAWRLAGASSYSLGRHRDALSYYGHALHLSPGTPVLHLETGLVFLAKGHWQRAAEHFFIARRDRACYGEAVKGLTEVALRQREWPQAALLARRQACLMRRDDVGLCGIAWTLLLSHEYEQASRLFSEYERNHGPDERSVAGRTRLALECAARAPGEGGEAREQREPRRCVDSGLHGLADAMGSTGSTGPTDLIDLTGLSPATYTQGSE